MSCTQVFCLTVGLCLALTVTRAQSTDSVADKVTNFPFKVLRRINGEATSLNQQLERQTQAYLQRMARKEAKLRGYEGEACPECANFTLVRNGTCLKCDTCGGTTGCS